MLIRWPVRLGVKAGSTIGIRDPFIYWSAAVTFAAASLIHRLRRSFPVAAIVQLRKLRFKQRHAFFADLTVTLARFVAKGAAISQQIRELVANSCSKKSESKQSGYPW